MEISPYEDHILELHALRNKILAFPEQDWTRERARVKELEQIIADEQRKAVA